MNIVTRIVVAVPVVALLTACGSRGEPASDAEAVRPGGNPAPSLVAPAQPLPPRAAASGLDMTGQPVPASCDAAWTTGDLPKPGAVVTLNVEEIGELSVVRILADNLPFAATCMESGAVDTDIRLGIGRAMLASDGSDVYLAVIAPSDSSETLTRTVPGTLLESVRGEGKYSASLIRVDAQQSAEKAKTEAATDVAGVLGSVASMEAGAVRVMPFVLADG